MKVKNLKQTIKWYDEHAEEYANAAFKKASIDLIDQFMKFLPSEPNVLDAGCGHGRDCELLHQKGAIVAGLDISKGLLAVARKRYPHLSFVQEEVLQVVFHNEYCDD
jgi:2-polyprenyl-3-methyl-5-hydroxy-6-metoxy-1,4-benzoquinol methylase